MRIDYSDGSFMLAWDKVRAWYSSSGLLKDAEYKKPVRAVAACHIKVITWLQKQGEQEIDLLNRGILKRNNNANI